MKNSPFVDLNIPKVSAGRQAFIGKYSGIISTSGNYDLL